MKVYKFLWIFFVLYSCNGYKNFKETVNYGDFYSPTSKLSLDLFGNKTFELYRLKIYSYGDCAISEGEYVASGEYEEIKDTIILKSSDETIWKLLIRSNEILEPYSFMNLNEEDKFYCWTKKNKSGKSLVSGGWVNGKKSGIWLFHKGNGKLDYEVIYDNETGLAKDTIIH